jgi:molybdopterin/thiamine biosynthesis adenylyltransferase
MASPHEKEYSRNYGFWNEAEQQALIDSRVALAGVGGDGFQLGYKLAMNGVLNFSVADPEEFEVENSNRVFGATASNNGRNKAEVFRDMIMDIRPEAKVDIYKDGVTEDNVEEFMHGADLLIDESELRYMHIGTMLARTARKNMIPNLFVMNVGFSGQATSFHPTRGKTYESVMGIPANATLDEIAEMEVDFSRVLPYIPNYADVSSLVAVQEGASLPSISQGVDIASAIGSSEAFLHLVAKADNKRRQPTWAPKFRYMDAYNGKSGIKRNARLSYTLGVASMVSRSALGLNPKASYRTEDRERRAEMRSE